MKKADLIFDNGVLLPMEFQILFAALLSTVSGPDTCPAGPGSRQ
jgi:hypothetical protein